MSSTASKRKAKKRAGPTSKRRKRATARSSSASAKAAAQRLFEDLGFSPERSRQEAIKADLFVAILRVVRERGLTGKQVAEILDRPHSRVSELLNGKLSLVSVETLIGYLDKLGYQVDVVIKRRAA